MWGRCASPLLCNQSQITQTNEPNIHLYGADLLIDPPGGVFAPVNGLGDLLLLGPPRIFSRYPVQCSRGDWGGGCIWSVTSHECLMGLGAGEFGGQVGALSSAVVGGSSGKADVTAACRIQWVTRMIVWCRLWCAGGGAAWKNTWCSLIWPKELIFPFSVGSENTPGMTEKSSCYIERRNLWEKFENLSSWYRHPRRLPLLRLPLSAFLTMFFTMCTQHDPSMHDSGGKARLWPFRR